MSGGDQYSPWGIPDSEPAAGPGGPAGGQLPVFGVPQGPQPDADAAGRRAPAQPPFGASTPSPANRYAQPAPPSMQSPYGMPLSPGGLAPLPPDDYKARGASDKKRKTLIASALAAAAVVGIGLSAIFLTGGSSPKSSATAADSQSSPATSGGDASNFGKPDGDALPASGGAFPSDGANPSGSPIPTGPGATSTQTSATSGGASSSPSAGPASHPASSTAKSAVPSAAAKAPGTSATSSAAPPPSTDCTFLDLPADKMPVIRQGTTNTAAVKQLQCLLKKSELGIKPLVIDGSWGPDTQSALVGFQGCNNSPTVHSPGGNPPYAKLAVDGVAGQQTWADLYFWDNQYFNNVAYYCNGTR